MFASPKRILARPYAVALFDVLGFKNLFARLGLKEITARYAALAGIVFEQDEKLATMKEMFPQIKEGPYWCADRKIAVMSTVHAAFASDTFLVWANHTWTALHEYPEEDLSRLAGDPSHDWLFKPIPCDAFLKVCNELMCRSLQVGLPLRGAMAVGDAILDRETNLLLGQPIIDASLLEHDQCFIGVGMCESFVKQQIPKRYCVQFSEQIKADSSASFSGSILDWPRHWRNTRSEAVERVVDSMNTDPAFSIYYENTLSSISVSTEQAEELEAGDACPVRSNYVQFSYDRGDDIAAFAVAVRGVVEKDDGVKPSPPEIK